MASLQMISMLWYWFEAILHSAHKSFFFLAGFMPARRSVLSKLCICRFVLIDCILKAVTHSMNKESEGGKQASIKLVLWWVHWWTSCAIRITRILSFNFEILMWINWSLFLLLTLDFAFVNTWAIFFFLSFGSSALARYSCSNSIQRCVRPFDESWKCWANCNRISSLSSAIRFYGNKKCFSVYHQPAYVLF